MKGINYIEYTRGLIVASLIWLGFVIYMIIVSGVNDFLKWAFGAGLLKTVILVLFLVVSLYPLLRLGESVFIKLTRNRFKYFSTKKIYKHFLKGAKQ